MSPAASTSTSQRAQLFVLGALLLCAPSCADGPSECQELPASPPTTVVLQAGEEGLALAGPRVRVDGIASIDVSPDLVDLHVTLSTEASASADAVAAVREQREALAAALREAGLDPDAIRVGHLSVNPVWSDYPHRKVRAYSASASVVATSGELERVGELAEIAAGYSISSLSTQYRSSQMTQKKVELRELALRAARDKAQQSARVLDASLGEVVAIEEGQQGGWGGWGMANMVVNEARGADTPDGALAPGAVTLRLSVHVEYALVAHPRG